MTHAPFGSPSQVPASLQGPPSNYRQMGGGYEQAVQQAQQQGQPQHPTQLGVGALPAPQYSPFPGQVQGSMPVPPPPQQQVPQQQGVPQQQYQGPGPQPGVPQGQQGQFLAQPWQQPQQQIPQQQSQGVDLTQRLAGPNVPAELQGRTIAEVITLNQGLRQMHLQNFGAQQQGQPTQQQPHGLQPPAGRAQQPDGQQPPAWDWRNPRESVRAAVGEVIQEQLGPMLAPVLQQTSLQSMQTARNAAAAAIGPQVFAAVEPQIIQRLQGIDPRALQNPETWRLAAAAIIGDHVIQQGRAPQGQQPQNGGLFPAQAVPPGANPLPNLGSFFSEQPNQGGPGAQGAQLTPEQQWAATQLGMSPADYAAWMGGAR